MSQLTFSCSKSKLETLEKGVKPGSNLIKKTPERNQNVVLVFLLTLNTFLSIVGFEQVNVSRYHLLHSSYGYLIHYG